MHRYVPQPPLLFFHQSLVLTMRLLVHAARPGEAVMWRSNIVYHAHLRMPALTEKAPALHGVHVRLDFC